ncbi:MAG: hypothetical protein LGR52_05295 [Candidatus Thiosymbion ectosymbiont of Robbea hypermnestra]|nr:hypothetical protein [Candidatus Thiosymbion ectosymbiont of Robbea hypermnestra]
MNQTPRIGIFLDEEERALAERIERDDYAVGKSYLSAKRREELQAAARRTTDEEHTPLRRVAASA